MHYTIYTKSHSVNSLQHVKWL